MTTHVDAAAAQPQWVPETDLYPVDSDGSVLAVWADELVVIDGDAGEVRQFLERCLRALPGSDGDDTQRWMR
jgi:hypothetical protein